MMLSLHRTMQRVPLAVSPLCRSSVLLVCSRNASTGKPSPKSAVRLARQLVAKADAAAARPRRPVSAFAAYLKEVFAEVKSHSPENAKAPDVMKRAAQQWKQLGAAEKEVREQIRSSSRDLVSSAYSHRVYLLVCLLAVHPQRQRANVEVYDGQRADGEAAIDEQETAFFLLRVLIVATFRASVRASRRAVS